MHDSPSRKVAALGAFRHRLPVRRLRLCPMSDGTIESAGAWWRRRRGAAWAVALGLAALGGWRGGLAARQWGRLIDNGAWINSSTHREYGLVVAWNGLCLLMALGVMLRLVRWGRPGGPSAGGAALLRAMVVFVAGECAVTIARWLLF